MDPSQLVKDYFHRPAAPDAGQIAAADVIDGATTAIVTAVNTLNVPRCDDGDRHGLRGQGFVGQRDLSQFYIEFLRRRPDYARKTGLDPAVCQAIVDKDESLDALLWTLARAQRAGADGQLLSHAEQSRMEQAALDTAGRMMVSPALPAGQRRLIRVYFGGVLLELAKNRSRKDALVQRQAKARPKKAEDNARHASRKQPKKGRSTKENEP